MAEYDNQRSKKGEGADFASFDPSKKKKKKKVVIHDADESSVGQLADITERVVCHQVEKELLNEDKENNDPISVNVKGDGIGLQEPCPWESSDRDYEYEELLNRVFGSQHNGVRQKIVLPPPEIGREGTRKTVFTNFSDICKSLRRQPDHVMSFFFAELSTTGSIDGRQRLIINGRFSPKSFEVLLRQYHNEYVFCNTCKRADRTVFVKENRINFLKCERCDCKRAVEPIKAGFKAQVTRRAAGRNGGRNGGKNGGRK